MKNRWALVALAGAQFIMVLDQSVMNVSISQLVADFNTTVTTIQTVITLYCLVMAMLMLAGGKIGDIIGRRRAFVIGLVIYASGSALTALAPNVAVLALGWSILEGVGAALVLPAMAALIAGNFEGKDRKVAYAVIGGVAGAGIAVGPIVGGWATTVLSWRVVFVGEVLIVLGILAMVRFVGDALRSGPKPRLDVVGTILSAAGFGTIVLGVLESSTWGVVRPNDAPFEIFGLSPTLFVIAGGGALLWAFVAWQRRRERMNTDPLVHLDLLKIPPLRSGLAGLFAQNLILMGIFFTVPLYLQLVLGLDALETGIKMLPVSITMFVTAAVGSRLSARYPVRTITRAGLMIVGLACLALLGTIEPELNGLGFATSMAVLGVGMGLIASQLGLVVQSSVDASGRGEAGGLQYTGQQLGSSLGVALIGAIVLAGLTSTFISDYPGRHADRGRGLQPDRCRGRIRAGLRAFDRDRGRCPAGGIGHDHDRRSRRRLRGGPAPGTQGGPARGHAPCPRLARVHRWAAVEGRHGRRIGRCARGFDRKAHPGYGVGRRREDVGRLPLTGK